MKRKCIWCLETEVPFEKKAHTIPKSLGGQNFNPNVCDNCNEYFGNRDKNNGKYSIEEALKETFNITRSRFLESSKTKRKTGRFKSKYFEVKDRKGNSRLSIKPSFKFSSSFQQEICLAFKKGLYKMFFEELNRQKEIGYEAKYDLIRDFARFNKGNLPVLYFERKYGMILLLNREAETPTLFFDRMKYLYSNDKFIEIEFLGHVFGFPTTEYNEKDLKDYISNSFKLKTDYFKNAILVDKLTDIDLALTILDDKKTHNKS